MEIGKTEVVVVRWGGGGGLSIDFSIYRWNFTYTQRRRYPNYNMYIIFADFLFLTIRSDGVGRRCLRRGIRRRRRRRRHGRSLLVVHPTRQLLRAAPRG